MDFFRPRADICTCASRYLMASRSWHAARARATLNVQEHMEQNHFKFGECLIARQELLVPTAAAPFASTFIVNTWKCVCQLSRAQKINCHGTREFTNRGEKTQTPRGQQLPRCPNPTFGCSETRYRINCAYRSGQKSQQEAVMSIDICSILFQQVQPLQVRQSRIGR